MMIKRQLGKTNMYVSPIGLGCMGFSHAYGLAEDKERAIQTIIFLIRLNVILVRILMELFLIMKSL